MSNKKKGLGVTRPKAPGRSTSAAGFAEPSRPPSRKKFLEASWSKPEGDISCHYSDYEDMALLVLFWAEKHHRPSPMPNGTWHPSFLEELQARGYDLRTLKFSIKSLPAKGIAAKNPQCVSARIRSGKPCASSSKHSPQPSKKN